MHPTPNPHSRTLVRAIEGKGANLFYMKYYLHDSNSFNDEKITKLYIRYGYEGLGLFYTILERLAAQEKPINTEVLKSQLNVGKRLTQCWNFMESIGIIHSNNGETFNKQLLNVSEKYQIKKQKNSEKIKQWRESEQVTENVTGYEPIRNQSKVNISKVNISKVKVYRAENISALVLPFDSIDFKNIWDVLIKEKKWNRKSFSALQASLDQLSKVSERDAIQMIKNTIAGEWQGLFELKKQNQYGKQQSGKLTDEGLANAWAEDLAKTAAKHT